MPEFVTTQQDATYVAPEIPEDPREAAINEAHDDARASVEVMTAATIGITAATGNVELIPVTGGIMYTARLYLYNWSQSRPVHGRPYDPFVSLRVPSCPFVDFTSYVFSVFSHHSRAFWNIRSHGDA